MMKFVFVLIFIYCQIIISQGAGYTNSDDTSRMIILGSTKKTSFVSLGFNYSFKDNKPGITALYRYKWLTNYTFHDIQIYSYYNPDLNGNLEKQDYFLLARFKKSVKSFGWPRLYDWTIYQVKSSTIEELNLRALIESGYGIFVYNLEKKDRKIKLNFETGLVFDYANLEAYTSNIASGYLKMAMDLEFNFNQIKTNLSIYEYFQMVNPATGFNPNQTRFDIEGKIKYELQSGINYTFGILFTQFQKLSRLFIQPESSVVVYSAIEYKY